MSRTGLYLLSEQKYIKNPTRSHYSVREKKPGLSVVIIICASLFNKITFMEKAFACYSFSQPKTINLVAKNQVVLR